jgi:hypothetical protein
MGAGMAVYKLTIRESGLNSTEEIESRRQEHDTSSHQPACGVLTPTMTSRGTAQVTCMGANVEEVSGVDGIAGVVRVGETCEADREGELARRDVVMGGGR